MSTPRQPDTPKIPRRKRGFEATGDLLARDLNSPAEKRGFGEAKLLTHWPEIVGEDLAAIARPVKITYGRGFGGTLVLLTTGANAPVLDMQKDRIIDRVNATYGYRAVAHVHITQTAPTGFAEGQVAFRTPKTKPRPDPDPGKLARFLAGANDIEDQGLKDALSRLARNVLTPRKS
ncbi:MAG: DUF721 domain-containing protein [Roseicyclus sp.]